MPCKATAHLASQYRNRPRKASYLKKIGSVPTLLNKEFHALFAHQFLQKNWYIRANPRAFLKNHLKCDVFFINYYLQSALVAKIKNVLKNSGRSVVGAIATDHSYGFP